MTNISSYSETTKHCVESAVRNYVTKTVINGELTEIDTIKAVTSVSVLFFLTFICCLYLHCLIHMFHAKINTLTLWLGFLLLRGSLTRWTG